MHRLWSLSPVLGIVLIAWLGLASARAASLTDDRPVVAVSVLPQAYFVEKVAGDLVRIEVMIPPGANETSFEPTISQMRAVAVAALYVKVGHRHFLFEQAWLGRLLTENPSIRVIDSSVGLPPNDEDPHVWVAPSSARNTARAVHAALVEVLPRQRASLDQRLAAFEQEIESLEADLHRQLDPFRGRSFLVYHPSWGHFAKEYGLQQLAIADEAKEPTPKQLAAIADRARAEHIHTIFVQPQFSSQQAELVASQIGAKLVSIDPLARDWSANLRKVGAALVESFQ